MIDFDDRVNAARDALAALDPPTDLWARATERASDPHAPARVVNLESRPRRPARWLAAAAVAAVIALGAALLQTADDEEPITTVPETTVRPRGWIGPVRAPSRVVHQMAIDPTSSFDLYGKTHFGWKWDDPRDTSEGWADIVRVSDGLTQWDFTLAAHPPRLADVEPGVVMAHGLVFDVNGDGSADYVLGLDNDTPRRGDLHVWITNLATGVTDERHGPPYGYPVEFSHPSERGVGQESESAPNIVFTFLSGALPEPFDVDAARFYAWASATRDGVVFAHDYAPDTGWLNGGSHPAGPTGG